MKLTAEYIHKISNGDIPEQIEINQEGDFRTLALNINQLINNLNLFVDEMKKMSQEHELGEIDVKVDISKFRGAYLTMASGVNEMVQSHIDVKKSAMAVFSEYGNGNFEANIATLPGKKIFINNTINVVQTNLKTISQTISDLAVNAKNGNLSNRADTSKLSGDWALMVSEVNNLIDQLLNPINEAVSVLQDMSDGNFSTSMKGDYKGDHAILKLTINQTIDQMPFKEAVRILQKLAKGDFTDKMQGDFKGDSLLLKNALNNTIESITEILTQVSSTVDEVTRGSMQVSDASSSLSQGATEQAASLEEITSSMSEIGSQTRTNASNASIASNLTYQAKEASETGNREMGDLNKSMSEISQSSRDISKIIKVIDEIAFQTNLLALNAAVEAARAGRHGKGFAVVAEEVRNLAARSATAAKETAEMIESSIRLVEKGANLANKTSNALEQIRDGAIKAADIVGDIAKSSNDQALAISQINEGLKQIDTVTQTNTASAEESASAAEVLSSQAENLKSMILKFNLNSTFAYDNQYASNSSTPKLMTGNNKNKSLPEKSENYKDLSFDELINLNNDDFGRY
jgi:methyl-accepting chemotaxis protein